MTTFARTALLTLCALALEAREPARAASPGDIDPTFNGGGPVLLDLAQTLPRITDLTGVAVDGQSRIVVTGNTTDQTAHGGVLIARLLADGTLDSSFGDRGSRVVQMGLGTGMDAPLSVAFDVGPRPNAAGWLVAGYATGADNRPSPLVGAFDATGTLDLTFGNGSGQAGSSLPQPVAAPAEAFGNGAAFTSDGFTFIATTIDTMAMTGSTRNLAVVKVTPEGQLVLGFGTQPGAFVGSFSETTDLEATASRPLVTASGIVVAGTTTSAAGQQVLLFRLTSVGQLDLTFGGGTGFVRVPPNGATSAGDANAQGSGIAAGPNGEIYVAGSAGGADGRQAVAVTRFTPSGVLDASFGTAGTARIQTSTSAGGAASGSSASDVAVQSDGKVLLFGTSSNATFTEIVVLRLDVDGTLDTNFGTGGIVRVRPADSAFASHGIISPDGRTALVTGSSVQASITSGLVARIFLTKTTTSTTTTTLPGTPCAAAPSVVGARCRIDALSSLVKGDVSVARMRRRLVKPLTTAGARLDGAETLTARKRHARLARAAALLRRVDHQLASGLAQRTIDDGVRADLVSRETAIAAELASLLATS